jgi:hypothetical protein
LYLYVVSRNLISGLTVYKAGLFSALITTFVQTSALLQADPQDRVTQLLTILINTAAVSQAPIPPPESFSLIHYRRHQRPLLHRSYTQSRSDACETMGTRVPTTSDQRWQTAGDNRHLGLLRWRLADLIAWVPMLLHMPLNIFLLEVVIWLYTLHRALFIAAIVLVASGATIYGIFAIMSVFATNSPFHWPVSSLIQAIINTFRWFGRSTIAPLHHAETLGAKKPRTRNREPGDSTLSAITTTRRRASSCTT